MAQSGKRDVPREPRTVGGNANVGNAAGASSEFYFAGLMFILAVLILWYFELPLNFDVTDPEFNPITFVPVVFAGIGAISLTRSVFARLRTGKFGSATASPTSARRGELFRPVMRTIGDIETTGDFVFVLKCIRKTRSSDDFEGHSSDKVIWKHKETAPGSTRSSQGVAVMFRIPPDALRTGPSEKGLNPATVRWEMTVTAPVRGVNFYAAFPIDVR